MEYIDVKQFKGKVRQDARKVTFKNVHGKTNTVVFSYQKTSLGLSVSSVALTVRNVCRNCIMLIITISAGNAAE